MNVELIDGNNLTKKEAVFKNYDAIGSINVFIVLFLIVV